MVTFFALLAHKITSSTLSNLLLRDPLAAQAFKGDAPYPDYPTDDLNVYEQ